jgi:hypothetical protein
MLCISTRYYYIYCYGHLIKVLIYSISAFAAAVNDPPSFTPGSIVTVAEDSVPYSAAWATNISSGPGESEPLSFTVNCSTASAVLFAVQPSMDAAGVLAFTPAANMFGNASCTVTLTEQMAGGLSAAAPLTIVVTPGAALASALQKHNCCVWLP